MLPDWSEEEWKTMPGAVLGYGYDDKPIMIGIRVKLFRGYGTVMLAKKDSASGANMVYVAAKEPTDILHDGGWLYVRHLERWDG